MKKYAVHFARPANFDKPQVDSPWRKVKENPIESYWLTEDEFGLGPLLSVHDAKLFDTYEEAATALQHRATLGYPDISDRFDIYEVRFVKTAKRIGV